MVEGESKTVCDIKGLKEFLFTKSTLKIISTTSSNVRLKGWIMIYLQVCRKNKWCYNQWNKKHNWEQNFQRKKKIAINTHLSIVTLNINGLNCPIKRRRRAEWMKSKDADRLTGWKSKIHVCAVSKVTSALSALNTGTISAREDEERHCRQKGREASSHGSPRLQTTLTQSRRGFPYSRDTEPRGHCN